MNTSGPDILKRVLSDAVTAWANEEGDLSDFVRDDIVNRLTTAVTRDHRLAVVALPAPTGVEEYEERGDVVETVTNWSGHTDPFGVSANSEGFIWCGIPEYFEEVGAATTYAAMLLAADRKFSGAEGRSNGN